MSPCHCSLLRLFLLLLLLLLSVYLSLLAAPVIAAVLDPPLTLSIHSLEGNQPFLLPSVRPTATTAEGNSPSPSWAPCHTSQPPPNTSQTPLVLRRWPPRPGHPPGTGLPLRSPPWLATGQSHSQWATTAGTGTEVSGQPCAGSGCHPAAMGRGHPAPLALGAGHRGHPGLVSPGNLSPLSRGCR